MEVHKRAPLQRSISELDELDEVTNCYTGHPEIIDNITRAKEVLSNLSRFSKLALDCEGVRIGRGGKLTLIQLGSYLGTVYLFDVLKLGEELFTNGMEEILESTTIVKYMFDCRDDSDILYHRYNVRLQNVLDMQIFEYIVRPIAKKPLPSPGRFNKPCIRGLASTIEMYVKRNQLRKVGLHDFYDLKKTGNRLMCADPTIWENRPLSDGMIRYAALDIDMIWIIVDTFTSSTPLTGTTLERVRIGSDIYGSLRRDADKKLEELFIRHPLLPSYVIPEIDCDSGEFIPFPSGNRKCNGCRRYFEESFITARGLCKDSAEILLVKHLLFY